MKGKGFRKGAWSEEEDVLLKKCIQTYGEGNWFQIPARAGLNRCRKSCRLRWLNYLRPNIKRGHIQEDEVDMIIRLHKLLGNRWSLIAGRIPGRTANDIKNYWNTYLAKEFNSSISAKLPKKDNHIVKINAIRPRPRIFKNNVYLLRATYPYFNQDVSPPPQPQPLQPAPVPPPQSNDLSLLETFLDESYYVDEGGGGGATSEGHTSASDKHLRGGSLWLIDDEELYVDDTQLWDLFNDNGGAKMRSPQPPPPPLPPPPPPPQSKDSSWLETFLDDSYYIDKHLLGGSMWSRDDEELYFDDTQVCDLLNMANDNGGSIMETEELINLLS